MRHFILLVVVCFAAVSFAAPKHKHHHHKHKESLEEEEVKADSDSVKFQAISDFEQKWKTFKITHDKKYGGAEEEEKRKEIFSKNLKEIALHNELYDQGFETYKQGITQFADLTREEFIKQITCLPQTNGPSLSENVTGKLPPTPPELFPGSVLPASTDWRSHGVVTRVKNQGRCGSCWAFAAVAALESQLYIKTRQEVYLSEQNLVDCSRENYGCHGGWPHWAYNYIQRNGGIDTEDSYQYEAEDGKCRYDSRLKGGHVDGFVKLQYGSEDFLQRAVAYIGPVTVGIDASGLQHYSSGIYSGYCSSSRINHAVVVVGYKTSSPGRDYWIIKNSWGAHWGMEGYGLIPRNKGNACGIGTYSAYPVVY